MSHPADHGAPAPPSVSHSRYYLDECFVVETMLVQGKVRETAASGALIGKGNHQHFMLKEIHEQPTVIGDTLQSYLDPATRSVSLPALPFDWNKVSRVTITGCGTACYAGMIAKYWFEKLARLAVEVDVASEMRYREPPLPDGGVCIAVSQSGETVDTLEALRYAQSQKQTLLSVVNVPESAIARLSDVVLPTLAGPEIGVASTKAFTCQLAVLAALAAHMAVKKGLMNRAQEAEVVAHLLEAPALVAEVPVLMGIDYPASADCAEPCTVLVLPRPALQQAFHRD